MGSFTSCKQEIVTLDNLESPNINIEQLRSDYIAKHGHDVVIEYTSLEKLNKTLNENGLPSVTLEELGATEEEYAAAQERIENSDVADLRCDNVALYNFLGDMNGNGILTTWDRILAHRVILNINPPTQQSNWFDFSISCRWRCGAKSTLN